MTGLLPVLRSVNRPKVVGVTTGGKDNVVSNDADEASVGRVPQLSSGLAEGVLIGAGTTVFGATDDAAPTGRARVVDEELHAQTISKGTTTKGANRIIR